VECSSTMKMHVNLNKEFSIDFSNEKNDIPYRSSADQSRVSSMKIF
jgi:hypothetical protein